MMPQTRAGTRTPAWPGSRGRGLPETGLAALSPIAIATHGMWPISTSIYRWRAWTGEREKQTSPSHPDSVGLGFQWTASEAGSASAIPS